jgi:CHAD domain-containing protein
MGHAIRGIFYSLLQSLEANRRAILSGDEDPERLHQLRVSLRKMRVILSVFRGVFDENWRKERREHLKRLMAVTGPARDLDVALERLRAYAEGAEKEERRGVEAIIVFLEKRRDVGHRELLMHLENPVWSVETETLWRFVKGEENGAQTERGLDPVLPALGPVLKRMHRKILRYGEKLGKRSPDREYHRLRIRVKKLRYLLEFFASVFDSEETERMLDRFKILQTVLGEHQDLTVQRSWLETLSKKREFSDREIREGLRMLRRKMKREALRKRVEFADRFEAFRGECGSLRLLLCRD